MKVYIIRHGQTDWNVEGKIQGRQNIPLGVAGKMQAQALVKGTENRPIAAIYSSPQLRTMGMAQAIAAAQNVSIHILLQLVEIGYGDWEECRAEDILTTDRELYKSWWQHPATVAPPGGEMPNQVDSRCQEAWNIIRRDVEGDTAVVAHGGILAHFIVHLLKRQPEAKEIVVSNVSIIIIDYDPGTNTCRLVELNNCRHLDERVGRAGQRSGMAALRISLRENRRKNFRR